MTLCIAQVGRRTIYFVSLRICPAGCPGFAGRHFVPSNPRLRNTPQLRCRAASDHSVSDPCLRNRFTTTKMERRWQASCLLPSLHRPLPRANEVSTGHFVAVCGPPPCSSPFVQNQKESSHPKMGASFLVDDIGLEPMTFRTSSGCSSQLS